jgi:hypothetical protein
MYIRSMIARLTLLLFLLSTSAGVSYAQVLVGGGLLNGESKSLRTTYGMPLLRVCVATPKAPMIFGLEYGNTHVLNKPTYGDAQFTSYGVSLGVKIVGGIGLEIAHSHVSQSRFADFGGLYEFEHPALDVLSYSLLIFPYKMNNISIGFADGGGVRLGLNFQVYDWTEPAEAKPKP